MGPRPREPAGACGRRSRRGLRSGALLPELAATQSGRPELSRSGAGAPELRAETGMERALEPPLRPSGRRGRAGGGNRAVTPARRGSGAQCATLSGKPRRLPCLHPATSPFARSGGRRAPERAVRARFGQPLLHACGALWRGHPGDARSGRLAVDTGFGNPHAPFSPLPGSGRKRSGRCRPGPGLLVQGHRTAAVSLVVCSGSLDAPEASHREAEAHLGPPRLACLRRAAGRNHVRDGGKTHDRRSRTACLPLVCPGELLRRARRRQAADRGIRPAPGTGAARGSEGLRLRRPVSPGDVRFVVRPLLLANGGPGAPLGS